MQKLSHLVGQNWLPQSYAPTFRFAKTSAGTSRIESVAPAGDARPFERLTELSEPPYRLLYVLHAPRGEGAPGRYTSPELGRQDIASFIERFRSFLKADARFDLWSHSMANGNTVVWDRHNQIFAYGNLRIFKDALREIGFTEGESPALGEHQHHYRQEFDGDAASVLAEYDWQYSPLKPEDEQ